MTLRFRRATKLRAMLRGLMRSSELSKHDQGEALKYLQATIHVLDPPFCRAWGDGVRCYKPAPDGSMYCDLHREAGS